MAAVWVGGWMDEWMGHTPSLPVFKHTWWHHHLLLTTYTVKKETRETGLGANTQILRG